ncbi:MAG: hypothetical protein AAFS10_23995, partial [Myxococcota bacterium]
RYEGAPFAYLRLPESGEPTANARFRELFGDQRAELIETLTGGTHDPHAVNRAPSYKGLRCEAGAWYFVVDQRGEAYMCRTGKRLAIEDDHAYLGNLVRGTFALGRGGICPYPICPCTVPANRGVVRRPGLLPRRTPRVEMADGV